jgi:valyl-tRNA synthetase
MPFITEEIYQMYFRETEKEASIHITSWPEHNKDLIDDEAEKAGDLVVAIVGEIRKYKSTNKLSLKAELDSITITCSNSDKSLITSCLNDIKMAGTVKEINFEQGDELKVDFNQ